MSYTTSNREINLSQILPDWNGNYRGEIDTAGAAKIFESLQSAGWIPTAGSVFVRQTPANWPGNGRILDWRDQKIGRYDGTDKYLTTAQIAQAVQMGKPEYVSITGNTRLSILHAMAASGQIDPTKIVIRAIQVVGASDAELARLRFVENRASGSAQTTTFADCFPILRPMALKKGAKQLDIRKISPTDWIGEASFSLAQILRPYASLRTADASLPDESEIIAAVKSTVRKKMRTIEQEKTNAAAKVEQLLVLLGLKVDPNAGEEGEGGEERVIEFLALEDDATGALLQSLIVAPFTVDEATVKALTAYLFGRDCLTLTVADFDNIRAAFVAWATVQREAQKARETAAPAPAPEKKKAHK